MNTQIYKIDSKAVDHRKMEEAAQLIRSGELVAFPTETVYGLGADALNPQASKKIYAAKGRPSDNPLIVHIAKFEDLEEIAKEVPQEAKKLADAFWPGPLTMIVYKNEKVPYETTGGMDTVAIRMPDHPAALELIRQSGCLIAAPSANTSGRPSPTLAEHVAEDLGGRIPMILDGGEVGIGIESTIIDLTEKIPMILRPGYITKEMLEAVIGTVRTDPGIIAADSTKKPKAPGMKYKHYAPKAKLILLEGSDEAFFHYVNAHAAEGVAALCYDGQENCLCVPAITYGKKDCPQEQAQQLFHALRKLDDLNYKLVYAACPQSEGLSLAVYNRMIRAAGFEVQTLD